MNPFYSRHFLRLMDFTPSEIQSLLQLAADLKQAKKQGQETRHLQGKNIALIFEKDSTRTRCSFEVAAFDQGAQVTYLGPSGSQIGHKESMKTPPACWAGCTTVFNIVVLASAWWKPWQNTLVCQCGMA